MKLCKNCSNVKELSEFHKHSKMSDGCINVCKECRKYYHQEWRGSNKDSLKVKKAQYHESVKVEANEKAHQKTKDFPDKMKEQNLKYSFGITLSYFNLMLEKQGNKCAICRQPETTKHQNGKVRSLAVDHCHTTGKIRGLLCVKCNNGLGNFKDNVEILEKSIEYLKASN